MKSRLSILIVNLFIFALGSIFLVNSVSAKTYQLGHVFGTSNSNHKGALKWSELVEQYTGGQVKIAVFPAGQLGGDRELGQAMKMGTLAFSVHNPGAAANDIRLFIGALPFLSPSYEMADKLILKGWIGEQASKYCLEKGWRVFAWGENDFRQLTNSKRPVKTVKDIEGLKLRVPQAPIMVAVWKALGAIPTPIAFPELYTALSQKTVDGQENGLLLTYSSRLYEVQKYFTFTNYMYSGTAFTVSDKVWKTFDQKTQEAIKKAAVEAADWAVKQNRADVGAAKAAMEKAGVEFYDMPPEELAKLKKIAVEVSWSMIKPKVGPEVWDKLIKLQE
ncbi:MAG: TRAP transporter substrate-binding protein [Deltaproteobacteria bacterium]|nr:TRAP transporter substrate-binding protein [Deltaproteobacteria bacterium]